MMLESKTINAIVKLVYLTGWYISHPEYTETVDQFLKSIDEKLWLIDGMHMLRIMKRLAQNNQHIPDIHISTYISDRLIKSISEHNQVWNTKIISIADVDITKLSCQLKNKYVFLLCGGKNVILRLPKVQASVIDDKFTFAIEHDIIFHLINLLVNFPNSSEYPNLLRADKIVLPIIENNIICESHDVQTKYISAQTLNEIDNLNYTGSFREVMLQFRLRPFQDREKIVIIDVLTAIIDDRTFI